MNIEGDVVPAIKVAGPSDWKRAVKDVSNGRVNVLVNGEIFNVPAGNYDFYAKFDSKTNGTGYYSYIFRAGGITTRNEYYYRNYLDYDQGHMEITGYPLN